MSDTLGKGLFGLGDFATGGLLSGVTGLLGGIIGGIGGGNQEKKNREFQERMLKLQRGWQTSDRSAYEQKYKPQVDFYQSQNLPQIDKVLATAVLSNLANRNQSGAMGNIDLSAILGGLNFPQPQATTQPRPQPDTLPRERAIAQRLLGQKYNLA